MVSWMWRFNKTFLSKQYWVCKNLFWRFGILIRLMLKLRVASTKKIIFNSTYWLELHLHLSSLFCNIREVIRRLEWIGHAVSLTSKRLDKCDETILNWNEMKNFSITLCTAVWNPQSISCNKVLGPQRQYRKAYLSMDLHNLLKFWTWIFDVHCVVARCDFELTHKIKYLVTEN